MDKNNKNKIPSFQEFIGENIFDAPKKDGRKTSTNFYKNATENIGEEEKKYNQKIEKQIYEDKSKNEGYDTWNNRLYLGNASSGYVELPEFLSVKKKPKFAGKPLFKSKSGDIYKHLVCIQNDVFNYVGNGLVSLMDNPSYTNGDLDTNDIIDSGNKKDIIITSIINSPYYDSTYDVLSVPNPDVTLGKIYIAKIVTRDTEYGGLFEKCVEILDDNGVSIIVPSENFYSTRDGEFKMEEQIAAMNQNKATFKPLDVHVAHKLNDRNIASLNFEYNKNLKENLREAGLINFTEIDEAIKNKKSYNMYHQLDVNNETVRTFDGESVVVPGDMIYYVRYANNPLDTRALAVMSPSETGTEYGEVGYVDLLLLNELFGDKSEGKVDYTKPETRQKIWTEYKGKYMYFPDRDILKSDEADMQHYNSLKDEAKRNYEGFYLIKTDKDIPPSGPPIKPIYKKRIWFDKKTLQLKKCKGNKEQTDELFEMTPEKYKDYLDYSDNFFAKFKKSQYGGRKTRDNYDDRQDNFPDVTKEMLNDPRIKLMDSLFGSYSESESSASNYREMPKSTYWFFARFYNEVFMNTPILKLWASVGKFPNLTRLQNTPIVIEYDIDWVGVINNYTVAYNKVNFFCRVIGLGTYTTRQRFTSPSFDTEINDRSFKRASESKDSTSRRDTGKLDSKGKKIYTKSEHSIDVDLYMADLDKYIELIIRNQSLRGFRDTTYTAKKIFMIKDNHSKDRRFMNFKFITEPENYMAVLNGELDIKDFLNLCIQNPNFTINMKSYIDYFSDVIGVDNIKEYINSIRGGESADIESTDDVELNIDETPEK